MQNMRQADFFITQHEKHLDTRCDFILENIFDARD